MGFWYSKKIDHIRIFFVDGTYIDIGVLENGGAILYSGTWTTQGEVELITKLRSFDKRAKKMAEIITLYSI